MLATSLRHLVGRPSALVGRQVRSVFLVTLIPRFFNQALCSACASVSAAVLGRLVGLPSGVDILITRDIRLAPAGMTTDLPISGAEVVLNKCSRSGDGQFR
jgi:hypothetical protein